MHIDMENWMGLLGPEKTNMPLVCIAIPGSHDSMTYSITQQSPVAPDSEEIVQRLMKCIGFLIRPIVYLWSVTQTHTVLEQLALGIRYFDVRIATKEGTEDIFFVHGLYGNKVDDTFEDIAKYLKDHKTEVVVLDMQHFYCFTEKDHRNFTGLLEKVFDTMICPAQNDICSVTLQWMRENGYQVIIIYRNKFTQGVDNFWKSDDWPTPWPETMSINDLMKFLDNRLHRRSKNRGFVSQCVLTPTHETVLKSPFSGIKSKCAIPVCKTIVPWLEDQEPGSINVAIADFIHINNCSFPKAVVSLNFRTGEDMPMVELNRR